jgi:hypothetical protein
MFYVLAIRTVSKVLRLGPEGKNNLSESTVKITNH